jgi:hypothetical protein
MAGCLWAIAAQVHAQQPKAVVLDFAGKGGDKARIQVIRALRARVAFERKDAAERVLAKRGLSGTSVAGRAAIAEALPVDYVIWGGVRGRGSAARATIRIAGPKGREISVREAGPPGTSKGNARIQKASRALLSKAIAAAPPKRAPTKRVEEREAASPVVVAPIPVVVAPEAPTASPPEVTEPAPIQISARNSTDLHAPYVTLLGGAGGRVRNIEVQLDDGSGGTATRKYESGVYLDIVFRLEVRPLARHRAPGARGLALEADGAFGVGLDTQPPSSTTKLDTKAWRVLGQLGYFHRFAKGELGGLIGIGFDRLELEANGFLPSIDYLFLRLGPAYRHFFIERTLQLRIDAGFRYPFSYGDLATTFGDAKGFGFDAGLTLGGELDVGFAYAARVSFDYFKPQFGGFAGDTPPSVPGAAQGRDATDFAINFHVMLGWAF